MLDRINWDQLRLLTSDRGENGFKTKLFNVCTNFTKVSLKIRARVFS